MEQGKKEVKTNKVSKNLLNQKKGVMSNLMQQVGEDDDSSSDVNENIKISSKDKKGISNIDYEMVGDYVPTYLQSQKAKKEEKKSDIIIEPLE